MDKRKQYSSVEGYVKKTNRFSSQEYLANKHKANASKILGYMGRKCKQKMSKEKRRVCPRSGRIYRSKELKIEEELLLIAAANTELERRR